MLLSDAPDKVIAKYGCPDISDAGKGNYNHGGGAYGYSPFKSVAII
ncbi:MAG: hypothetical protein ACOYOS_09145 [Syntrophales bacterium]